MRRILRFMQSRGDIFTWQSQEVVIASEAKQSIG
jgi:hypothetical protein